LKLEISYRVITSWKLLVSFRGFFWRLNFFYGEEFSLFFFCLNILSFFINVNGKATVWHTPLFFFLISYFPTQILQTEIIIQHHRNAEVATVLLWYSEFRNHTTHIIGSFSAHPFFGWENSVFDKNNLITWSMAMIAFDHQWTLKIKSV
jgi:hypothetical protein